MTDWLLTSEAAAYCCMSPSALVSALYRCGISHCTVVGKSRGWRVTDLDRFLSGAVRPDPKLRPDFVYAIENKTTGHIKIGHSRNPRQRLDNLQGGGADPLELLGYFFGGRPAERALHERLKEFRVRGEWFRPDPAVLLAVREVITRGRVRKGSAVETLTGKAGDEDARTR